MLRARSGSRDARREQARRYPICNAPWLMRTWWVWRGRDPFWLRWRLYWRLRGG